MHTTRRTVLILAIATVNILSTLLPVWPLRYALLAPWVPVDVLLGAQHVTLFAGVTMLILARPAAEGHQRTAYAMMAIAGVAVLANVLKGLDIEEATLNLALFVGLWRTRHLLHTTPLRYTIVDLGRLGVFLVILLKLYDITGKVLLRGLHLLVTSGEGAFPAPARLIHLLTAKLALEHAWFTESQFVLPVFLVSLFLIMSWTALIHGQDTPCQDDLYSRFGRASHNSLAYLARRNDVSTYLDPTGYGAVTYRQVGRVALQVGAILAPAEQREAVYAGFVSFCRAQHLIPAAVALAQEEQPVARARGMRTLAIGTEAIVDLREFSTERLGKKMRWARRSLAKRGFYVEVFSAAEISDALKLQLDRIDAMWRDWRGGQMHGFSMTLGRFPSRNDPDCLIAVARDDTRMPVAYLTLLPGGDGFYSLDVTRRALDAPNAIIEFLLMDVLEQLRERGAATVSLNFSTFSALTSSWIGARLLRLFGTTFQLGSLEAFNAKFRPQWVPRYLAFPSWGTLPDVAYAILTLEGVDRMVLNACARSLRDVREAFAMPAAHPHPKTQP